MISISFPLLFWRATAQGLLLNFKIFYPVNNHEFLLLVYDLSATGKHALGPGTGSNFRPGPDRAFYL